MLKRNKSLSSIVVTTLLFVITILSTIGFSNWFNTYQSDLLSNIEVKSNYNLGNSTIETIIGDFLYFKNGANYNLTVKFIKINNINCNYSNNISVGINIINISSCLKIISTNNIDILVFTNNGIFQKKIYLKNKYNLPITSSSISFISTINISDVFGDNSSLGLYNFENNIYDFNGINNFSVVGNYLYNTSGKFNNSLQLDGSLGTYAVANSSILPGSGGFSISFWLKWNGDPDYAYLLDNSGGGNKNGFYLIVHDISDEIYWGFKNSVYGSNIMVPYPISERNKWTHIVVSWDGTTNTNSSHIYKNGIDFPGTQTVPQTNGFYNLNIGVSAIGYEWFNGQIDQLRFFNRSLNLTEVEILYNESKIK